jgi:hypothetical protein
MRWLNILFVLLVNAVPLYGVKVLGWSIGVVLLLYWVENLLVAVFTCARIDLHRALTRKAGHWRSSQLGGVSVNGKPKDFGLLGEYAIIAFPFTLVHGVFVFAIVFLIAANKSGSEWQFSYEQFRFGALQMLAVLGVDFLVDAALMRSRSFAWIKTYTQQRMGRVLILHLGFIFGMWGMAASDSPIAVLYVLIGLKTLWDLAASSASAKATALPPEPPAWALKLADKVGKAKGHGADEMRADWARSAERARVAAIEDEKVRPA